MVISCIGAGVSGSADGSGNKVIVHVGAEDKEVGGFAVLHRIVDDAPLAIFWKDRDSVYRGCNRLFAEYAGLSEPSEIVGKADHDLVWKEHAGKYRDDDRAVIATGTARLDMEELGYIAQGKQVWWRASKVPLRDAQNQIVGLTGFLQDITDLKKVETQKRKSERARELLRRCNNHIVTAESETELLADICQFILDGGYRMAWIGNVEHDAGKSILPVAQAGAFAGYLEDLHVTWDDVPLGRGPSGTAVRERRSVTNQNFLTNPAMKPWRDAALKQGFQSSIATPLLRNGDVWGLLTIYAAEADAFDEAEVSLLEELARNIAFGIEALRERQRRVQTLEQAVGAIAATIEMRDPYTAGHENRTTDLAVAIALELKLPSDRIEGLRIASLLHDIGKIRVPIEILTSPRRLSPAEYAIIKVHPDAGHEILKNIEFPWPVADIVRQHHERVDGSGYPLQLKGPDMLIESRILAVADVVESMSSHRPYRAALGIDAALKEIENNKGTLYDASVVDTCVRLIREKKFSFKQKDGLKDGSMGEPVTGRP